MSWPFVNLLFSTERISMSSWESTWCSSFLSGSSSQYEIKGELIWNSLDIFVTLCNFCNFSNWFRVSQAILLKFPFPSFGFVEQNDFEGFFLYSRHWKHQNTLKFLSSPSLSSHHPLLWYIRFYDTNWHVV